MRILCAYSGVNFSCEHFPASLFSRESFHPIFNIPQRKLIPYLSKWSSGELTSTDSYLLFLSVLKSTDLVDFRVPAHRTEQTDAIIAQSMEHLFRAAVKLNTVTDPSQVFPRYVISPDTKDLSNVRYWIENWEDAYASHTAGYHRQLDERKLIVREAALSRLIKNPHKPISAIASQIAEWASIAGSFPSFTITNPFPPGNQISCSDYWRFIIIKCARAESLFAIRRKDIEEVLEHCEENVPIGSIYSNALFGILRGALERQKNFLGLGDLDIRSSSYTLLSDSATVEDANLKGLIDSAPAEIPRPEQYPNKFAYMKAKMRWDMAKKFGKSLDTTEDASAKIEDPTEGEL